MTQMRKINLFAALAMVSILMAHGACFGAEQYPTKPIQVIVPFTAGGSSDLTARTVEKFWTKYSPQPMLVINKPGAGGVLGEEFVVRSKPDGYTLYVGQGSGHDLVMPHLQKMPFDPLKDITPVARISIHSIVICVSGKSPIKSMKDLIDYANKGNKITAAVSTAAGKGHGGDRDVGPLGDGPHDEVHGAGGGGDGSGDLIPLVCVVDQILHRFDG
jgi:tripartite-type tricarboxylate transporter receptor subunit TctC